MFAKHTRKLGAKLRTFASKANLPKSLSQLAQEKAEKGHPASCKPEIKVIRVQQLAKAKLQSARLPHESTRLPHESARLAQDPVAGDPDVDDVPMAARLSMEKVRT